MKHTEVESRFVISRNLRFEILIIERRRYDGRSGKIARAIIGRCLVRVCVRNRGYEIQLDVTPVDSRDFRWNATFTWSKNENRILSLAEGADENQLISSIGSVSIIGRVGGTTGDLWGYKLVRDPEGYVVINDNGLPERSCKKIRCTVRLSISDRPCRRIRSLPNVRAILCR